MPMNFRQYPPWWNADITLYNRDVAADGTVTWYRKQLSGCFYQGVDGTQIFRAERGSKTDVDTFVCRIRESDSYRAPDVWATLDAANKALFFTVYVDDIIVPGHVADAIDESAPGLRSSELLEKYTRAGAFRVSGAMNSTGSQMGSPHYKATGVV